jgi:hypothetical protein
MKPLKIFLCHALEDKKQVVDLYHLLIKQGADPWLDSEKILPGQEWNFEINKALDESDVILLCLSKRSVSKEGYVQREIRIALDHALEMPEGHIFLIPARLEECSLPQRISSYQWVDLFNADGMTKLLKSLNLRASQVRAQPLSAGGAAPISKPPTPKSQPKPKPSNTTINIHGNVSGSNIVIGNDNEVNN